MWVGNVEAHLQSSGWYSHQHHLDPAYSNVILHIVWSHDQEVFVKGRRLYTLVISDLVSENLLDTYKNLFYKSYRFIHCEPRMKEVPPIIWEKWKESLFIERISNRVKVIEELLVRYAWDWERVCFVIFSRYLGGKVNGSYFEQIAHSVPFTIIRSEHTNPGHLEALFFGQAGWLHHSLDYYGYQLKEVYEHLKRKYHLEALVEGRFKFFRLRPSGFPTLRLVQLAQIYEKNNSICWEVLRVHSISDLYQLLQFELPTYWQQHYKIGKERKFSQGKLTRKLIDKLAVNAFLPFKICFERQKGQLGSIKMLDHFGDLMPENNQLIKNFKAIGIEAKNIRDTQALIQLKQAYCDHHQCLKCAVGCHLLKN